MIIKFKTQTDSSNIHSYEINMEEDNNIDMNSLYINVIRNEMIKYFNETIFIDYEDKQNTIEYFFPELYTENIDCYDLNKVIFKYLKSGFNFSLTNI